MERTLVLVKPDGLQRGLIGEILHRFERKGLKLVGLKMVRITDEVLNEWYIHLKDKSFFPNLKSYMMKTPIVAMVWEGMDAVPTVRNIVGITKSREAEVGSIRGDFAMSGGHNITHASDSLENAKKEMAFLFQPDEIFEYNSASDLLIYSEDDRS